MMETYYGCVRTPADAIKLFEACRVGLLPRVQRRLSEKERQAIRSGSVFVWDEREAGMRRWTDGKSWSASRVSGSFLTYREMEGKRGAAFPPSRSAVVDAKNTQRNRKPSDFEDEDNDGEIDGYRYKIDGLMKQSFSITTSNGQHLHLISYYSRPQAGQPDLPQPCTDPSLRHIVPAKGMYPESSVHETQGPALSRGPLQQTSYTLMLQQAPPSQPPAHGYPPQYAQQQQPPAGYWPPSPMPTPPYSHPQQPPYPAYTPSPLPPPSQHQQPHQHAYQHQAPPPPHHYQPQPQHQPQHQPQQPQQQQQQYHHPPPSQHPERSPLPLPQASAAAHQSRAPPPIQHYPHPASQPSTRPAHTSIAGPHDSPQAQHLQAAARAAELIDPRLSRGGPEKTQLPPITNNNHGQHQRHSPAPIVAAPPPRTMSASPPKSSHSETAPGTATTTTNGAPTGGYNKTSLSSLLHPTPTNSEPNSANPGSNSAGSSPRTEAGANGVPAMPGGGQRNFASEDVRALNVLNKKFCV